MKTPRGFTLIELMVVIAIIGLLSSIILASLSTARTKGQDAARISDIKSLKTALELYYAANNAYPTSPVGTGDVTLDDPTITSDLVPKYIGSIPAVLIADGDHYYSPRTGGLSQYGLYVYTASGGWCKTGVATGDLATNGWWGYPPLCSF